MLELGEIIADRFRVERALGAGGMAVVYEVTNTATGGRAAAKMLNPNLAHHPTLAERFVREARIQGQLEHPCIARIHDLLTHRGSPVILMEYLNGRSLGDTLRQGQKFSPTEVVDLASRLAGALAFAHDHGVVHRDLKPDNIFLVRDAEGRTVPKLLDFGIAKVRSEGNLTATSAFIGTYCYASPEQIISTRDVDARSDLYSFGVLLWELLSGHEPYAGCDSDFVIQRMVVETPLDALPATVPEALRVLVERLTAKRPEERPRTAHDVVDLLSRFGRPSRPGISATTARTILDGPAPPPPPASSASQPHRPTGQHLGTVLDSHASTPGPGSTTGRRTPVDALPSVPPPPPPSADTRGSNAQRTLIIVGVMLVAIATGAGVAIAVRGTTNPTTVTDTMVEPGRPGQEVPIQRFSSDAQRARYEALMHALRGEATQPGADDAALARQQSQRFDWPEGTRVTASDYMAGEWGNRYEPRNVLDGDPNTSWQVEGAQGREHWIHFGWNEPMLVDTVFIRNGFQYTGSEYGDLFDRNSRVARGTVYVGGQARSFTLGAQQRGWASISIDPVVTDSIHVAIHDVTVGSSWDDLAVSDIAPGGFPTADLMPLLPASVHAMLDGDGQPTWRPALALGASDSIPGEAYGYTFGVEHLLDGLDHTSWQVTGGTGARLTLTFDPPAPLVAVKIANGFQHDDPRLGDLFLANRRVRSFRVRRDGSDLGRWDLQGDARTMESLYFDGTPVRTLELEILAIYDGSRWSDLALTDMVVLTAE